MPRKSKKVDEKQPDKPTKKNLMTTIVKDVSVVENQDIILQLPLSETQLNQLNNNDTMKYAIPEPYEPNCFYISEDSTLQNIQDNHVIDDNFYGSEGQHCQQNHQAFHENILKSNNNCYWCCHPIENRTYGMPSKYNTRTDTYVLYGNFCSLECANAYNFSVHSGSDKVWEINSFIQMLSKHYGFTRPIRPAPSRFLLQIFNGPMTIEEFRSAHSTSDKTHLLNLPPMISTSFNYEIVNTSYLKNITDNMNTMKPATKKLAKSSIDSKLNLVMSS